MFCICKWVESCVMFLLTRRLLTLVTLRPSPATLHALPSYTAVPCVQKFKIKLLVEKARSSFHLLHHNCCSSVIKVYNNPETFFISSYTYLNMYNILSLRQHAPSWQHNPGESWNILPLMTVAHVLITRWLAQVHIFTHKRPAHLQDNTILHTRTK